MLKIRMTRTGKRNHAMFRMVVTEHSNAVKGKFHEILGHVNPHTDPTTVEVDAERAMHWIKEGVHVTQTAARHLKTAGVEVPEKLIEMKPKSGKKKEAEEGSEEGGDATPKAEGDAPAEDAPKEEAKKEEAPAEDKKEGKEEDKKDA